MLIGAYKRFHRWSSYVSSYLCKFVLFSCRLMRLAGEMCLNSSQCLTDLYARRFRQKDTNNSTFPTKPFFWLHHELTLICLHYREISARSYREWNAKVSGTNMQCSVEGSIYKSLGGSRNHEQYCHCLVRS